MSKVRLKIDVSGTVGDAAFCNLEHYDEMQSAHFGPQFGSSGICRHDPDALHPNGEWIGAEIQVDNPLLAQYAVHHYLKQQRVLDADIVD